MSAQFSAAGELPASCLPLAVASFQRVIDMVNMQLASQSYVNLLVACTERFATAIGFVWNASVAEPIVRAAIATKHSVVFPVLPKGFRDRFGQWEAHSAANPYGRIFLDSSLFNAMANKATSYPDLDHTAAISRVVFLMFIKAMHEIAHAMTRDLLSWVRLVYASEPYKRRKLIPRKNTPPTVGRMRKTPGSRNFIGDSGNALEELMSSGLRFSYIMDALEPAIATDIIVCTPNGHVGYLVPDATIDAVLANPIDILPIFTLEAVSELVPVPEERFNTLAIKCAHGTPPGPAPGMKV